MGVRAIPEEGLGAAHMSSTGVSSVSIWREPTRDEEGGDAVRLGGLGGTGLSGAGWNSMGGTQ